MQVVFLEYSHCEDIPNGVSKDIKQEYRAQSGGLGRIGDNGYPSNPLLDRAKGYLLKGKAKSAVLNYGNFTSWDEYPAGGWGKYSYLPNLSFIAGIAGQVYSSDFIWVESDEIIDGAPLTIWKSSDAYDAWFQELDTVFKAIVYDVRDGKGKMAVFRQSIDEFIVENGVQWTIDHDDDGGKIIIYIDDYLTDNQNGPNYSNQRVGLAYPWAIRPALKERLDEFDLFDYGDDLEEWTDDDNYMFYDATFQESYFTWNDSKSDWQAVTKSREYTHNVDVTAGDIFGGVELLKGSTVTDNADPFYLLAHSEHKQTWPTEYDISVNDHVPFWPGWWADKYWGDSPNSWYDEGITNCNGSRQDDDCWKPSIGDHVSDMDIFMQFDDRWAFRGNQVENNVYLQTGYPLGLRVMSMGHSYGISYAEDIMFFTVVVRNESGFGETGQWCAFEDGEYKYNDDGTPLCGDPMIMADGTLLNAGKGFNYKELFLGFYMDADVLAGGLSGYSGLHSNDDDFMEYIDCEIPSEYYPDGECKYINGEKLRVSMATIYDYDGQSGQPSGETIGMVAVQLLDSPKATSDIDIDQDGAIDIEVGEPLKMTDWHWFDWYNRPGVVATESNQGASAGGGGPQAANKEEINYKIMSGDTTNLSASEKSRYFHTADPTTDLDVLLNPHFDSLEGLAETEFFTRDPDGLDAVLEMTSGPFDLDIGEEVSFSFCVIFGQNHADLIRNAEFAQIMYNAHYQGYSPPNPPKVKVVGGHGKATIYWTNDAEVSKDVVTTYTDFEGYKIYKSMDNGSTWGNTSHKITDNEGVHVGWLPIKQYDLSKEEDESFCILGFEDVNENGWQDGNEQCKTSPGECDPCIRDREFSGPDPLAPWFNLGENTGFDAIRLDPPDTLDGVEYHYAYTDTNVFDGLKYSYSVTAYDIGVPAADTILTDQNSLEISSIEDPGKWSLQNPYSYLENPKGTTIHDRNFDNVIPGYTPELGQTLNVKVVPNPYIAHSKFNESEYLRQIRFTHLPTKCEIQIFTVSGEFVFKLDHASEVNGNAVWDLRTINNQEASPGLYLFSVSSPGRETFIGKFAIVR